MTMMPFAVEVSPFRWFVLAAACAIVILGFATVPRQWRGEGRSSPTEPVAWWPWGGPLYRGFMRVGVFSGFCSAFVLLVVVAGLLTPERETGPFARPLWFVIPALGGMGLGAVVWLAIVLINRPRAFVPPHLRDQPGALHEWLASRSRRRRKRAR